MDLLRLGSGNIRISRLISDGIFTASQHNIHFVIYKICGKFNGSLVPFKKLSNYLGRCRDVWLLKYTFVFVRCLKAKATFPSLLWLQAVWSINKLLCSRVIRHQELKSHTHKERQTNRQREPVDLLFSGSVSKIKGLTKTFPGKKMEHGESLRI